MGGKEWLSAAPPRFFCNGTWYPLENGILAADRGSDALGNYDESSRTFLNGSVTLAIKAYEGGASFVFEQRLHRQCSTQATKPALPSSDVDSYDAGAPGRVSPFLSFPAWEGGLLQSLRYLTWQGARHSIYQWTVQESHGTDVTRPKADGTFDGLAGLSAGPTVLMDPDPRHRDALVIGPLTHVKQATSISTRAQNLTWELGVSSEVAAVGATFVHRTLLAVGPGPTRAMRRWGGLAQREAGLVKRFQGDISTTKLGYFTDNGAMLYGDAYGHDIDACCNATTLAGVLTSLEAQAVPISWVQMDDWWYEGFKPRGGGVFCTDNWRPWPSAFPAGLDGVQTKLPWLLYAPYFCSNSSLIAELGTQAALIAPGGYAVPRANASLAFYRALFASKYAGDGPPGQGRRKVVGTEIDFLNDNFLDQPVFRESLGESEGWLAGMHAAAAERGMSIQYCMAMPSDLLASLKNPYVTNYRASDDYAGSSVTNFNLQASSLLGWSLALRPSKDVFFTTENLPKNPYMRRLGPNHRTVPGVDLELNAAIASLSTGPVAIGDAQGGTDRALVMRACRLDGVLLQPDKPLTAIDAHYDGRRSPPGGFRAAGGAQVWTTYSAVRSSAASVAAAAAGSNDAVVLYRQLLSIDVNVFSEATAAARAASNAPFVLDPIRDFYPALGGDSVDMAEEQQQKYVFLWDHDRAKCAVNGSTAVSGGCVVSTLPPLDDSARPLLRASDSHRWSLMRVIPVLPSGWVFLGELEKWVAASSMRFSDLASVQGARGVSVSVDFAPGREVVELVALAPHTVTQADRQNAEWTIVTARVVGSEDGGKQMVCIGQCS